MKSFEVGKVYSLREDGKTTTPYVEIWKQPLFRYLLWKAYHWWDMRSFPMKMIDRWHYKLFAKKSALDLSYLPLRARQDLRCYHLSQKGRVSLATVNITHEQYEAITGKTLKKKKESGNAGELAS